MAPKDIRAFFGAPAGSKKPASKPAEKKIEESAPKKPPAKATPKKSPAAKPKKSTRAKAKPAAAEPSKSTTKSKKRKLVIQSDSDFEDEALADDDDFEEDDEKEEDDDDIEFMDEDSPKVNRKGKKPAKKAAVIDMSDEEDALEVVPPPKKRRAPESAKPAAKAAPARALPASLTPTADEKKKKPAARKSAASTGGKKKTAAQLLEESLSDSAKKAIEAVNKATKSLPSNEELLDSEQITKIAVVEAGGWQGGGGADKMPENHGNVEYPRGHPDCLAKVTIVISGILDSMMRDEATEYIKRHGGRVTSGVTGNTTFLLCGKETGNSKFNKAKEKGSKLLTEQGLMALVAASEPFVEEAAAEEAEAAAEDDIMEVDPPKLEPKPESATPSKAGTSKAGTSKAGTSRDAQVMAARKEAETPVDPNSQLWVDKWKPKVASDLVGNPQGQTIIRMWLQDWDRVHIHGQAPRAAPGAGNQRKDMSKKALLVSGPPGIGKTTSAHILSKELGFEVVEVNASDARNKSDGVGVKGKLNIAGKLSNRVKELVTNTAISLAGVSDTKSRRQVLVMDEVDGMSGGDRGGVSDLINNIKASKMPIICVCNDKYKQTLKSLKNHCLEIDWRKPTKLQAAQRLKIITKAEGLTINQSAMDALVESSQGDMRVIIGQLQMHRVRAKALSYDEVKKSSIKDMDKSPFEMARQLLSVESINMSIGDRMDAVFQDMDLVPLLAQENYLNHKPSMAQNENQMMQIIAKSADAISEGDTFNRRVRMKQQWSLAPAAALLSTIFPAAYIRGSRVTYNAGEMNFPRFTAWMGNNSSQNKQKRLSAEINTKLLAAGVVCDRKSLRLNYMPLFRLALTKPLATNGADGIEDVISIMQSYLINREDFDTIMDITKCKTKAGWGADPMQGVETKVKSAFTRSFNKAGLPVRCTIMVEDGKKSKGKKAAPAPVDTGDDAIGGEIAEAAAVNAKDDDGEAATEEDIKNMKGVSFVAKAPAGKGKGGKAAASKATTSKGAGRGGAGRGGKAGRGRGK